ncbi:MAG: hypothetical protein JKY48_03505 [Flavobacteriales bacterium]|nr:hypothetical protein [Flavobacteriales bacterium]
MTEVLNLLMIIETNLNKKQLSTGLASYFFFIMGTLHRSTPVPQTSVPEWGICKLGKSQLRKALYLCSWSTKKCNKNCIEMYDRLKAKGKPEKVIKVPIANKWIK